MTDLELLIVIALFAVFVGYPVAKGFMEGVGSVRNKWIKISAEDARQHKLYGIGGWLIVLMIGTVFGSLAALGSVKGAMFEAGIGWADLGRISKNFEIFIYALLSIQFAFSAVVLWLMVTKAQSFRRISTLALLLGFPVAAIFAIAYPNAGSGEFLAYGLIEWILRCVIWLPYFQVSKRVRVTFEHAIRFDDPMLHEKLVASKAGVMSDYSDPKSPNTYTLTPSCTPGVPVGKNVGDGNERSEEVEMKAWEAALNEYEGPQRDRGLYAKLYAEHNGDEARIKSAYIKNRACEISEINKTSLINAKKIKMQSVATELNAIIEKREWSETEVGGLKCIKFMDGYLGFSHLNKYFVFTDVDLLCSQLNALEKDEAHKISGAILEYPFSSASDEECLKEKKYLQKRIDSVSYFLLENGRFSCLSIGKFYVFEDLSVLRSAVRKGDQHKLAAAIYEMDFR